MKRFYFGTATVFISVFIFFSCLNKNLKPENLQMNENIRGSENLPHIENDYLSFSSPDSFESYLESLVEKNNMGIYPLNNISGFESADDVMRVDTSYHSDIDSDVLRSVINRKNIVKVGEWIIKIDKQNERVLVLHNNKIQEINDLINSNVSNPNVWVFSTNDDVFELLKRGFTTSLSETELERWGIFCRNKCGGAENSSRDNVSLTPLTTIGSVQARYIRYGFYYELFVRNAVFERTYGVVPPNRRSFLCHL